jgi:hypothetical protein
VSHQAPEQLTAALAKHGEAIKRAMETSQAVRLADGKPGFRLTPEMARKLEEAKADVDRAFERDRAERDRLLQLEMESWRSR